ncbi:MAG: phosphoglycerate dehydrogenase [Acidobacteriota bacterium]
MNRVLVTNLIMQRELDRYRHLLRPAGVEVVCHPVRQFLTEADLLPIIGGFDGVIAGDDQFTEPVLRAGSPRLRVISKWGVGLDSIDLSAASRLGIKVYRTPGAFGDAVAEVVMGYLLMLSRKLHLVDQEIRRGGWPKPAGRGLRGCKLGIVGLGSVGRAVARRAAAFGLETLATDIREIEAARLVRGRFASLAEVVAESDYLLLSCNLTPANREIIGPSELARMKSTAFLINVARGALIDEAALIRALRCGRIAGAALDVFQQEPLPNDHPFRQMKNVILGSHNAHNLREANEQVCRRTVENLLEGLAAKRPSKGRIKC